MSKNKKVDENPEMKNYRELLEYSIKNYKDNVAYKYKKNLEEKNIKYIEKTYKQFGKDVKSFGTALLKEKFKGKRIALIGSNRYEWCVSYFAVTCSGIIIAPIDKALPENEIASLIKRSEVEAVIFDEKYLEIFKKLKNDESNNLKTLICMDDIEDKDIITFNKMIEEGKELLKNKDKRYEKVKIDENEMSIMLFTSGTTSQAKIVMLSQKNICSNLYAYQTHFKILPTDTLLSFLPIHHTFESSITILYGFYCGATIAFCDGLRYIQTNLKEYEVSIFVAVPLLLETMYKKIMKAIDDKGKTKLIKAMIKISNFLLKLHIDLRRILFKQIMDNFGGKLRMVLYGAASLDKETIVGLNNFGINSIQGYGLTETSPVLAAESETRHKPGSVGYPLDNIEIKIINVDKEGTGEVCAKGPNIMLGYYNDEKKTKEALEDGWFKTGDLGYIDEEGFLFITGRKNDVIVLKNGKNVYPQEIEFLINKLQYVEESMVYSREETKTDTLLVAKIVYNKEIMEEKYSGQDFEKIIWKDIKELNKTLPTYKHIKKIIVTDEPMVKTTTQKVKRNIEIKKAEKQLTN
ncbi:MAG: AMP-dependent synthetase/ligase [Candidatus Scatovivens sp.]